MPIFDPAQARRSGVPIAWPVNEAHIIRRSHDGTVLAPVVAPKAPRLYSPSTRLELPGEFAKLERGNEEAVLKFASTYGLLGYSNLLPTKEFAARPVSDPLEWIWSHAETVRLAFTLKDVLDRDAADELTRLLRGIREPRFKGAYSVSIAEQEYSKHHTFYATTNPRNLAAAILKYIVDQNIAGIHQKIAWDERRGTFVPYTTFRALIEAVYWHIANAVTNGRVAQCGACGGRFIQTDRRQRFCPTGTKQESPCAVRARVRTCRQRKREKEHKAKQQKNKLKKKSTIGARR